jgi:Flp pilus assembly protein TadG
MRRAGLATIVRDARGAAAVEFAIVAPAFLMVLLGLMDIGYNLYASTLLEGAVHKAGRDSTIEGAEARGLAIDNRVRDAVHDIVPGATVAFSRRAYINYTEVGRAEEFTDTNGDGICNDGEPFEDIADFGTWNEDRGQAGMGGARDAVLYTVTVTYPRAFPVIELLGFSPTVTASTRTVLRNQPYSQQNRAPAVGNCD